MTEDATRPVRKGEELDVAALARFLSEHVAELEGVGPSDVEVEQFPGGHSNLTYLVRARGHEYVLRRPPFGNTVKTAHDMGREVRMLTRLAPFYAKTPRVVASSDDPAVLGAPFYLMQRLRGTILRRALPAGVELGPDLTRALGLAVVDGLAELHAIDVAAHGLLDLGKPDGYVERQVRGWSERYVGAQTDDIPDMPAAAEWFAKNIPSSPPPTVLHNDWKYDNLVLDPQDLTRIIGVLDWEMSTLGDPLTDLATTLAYWIEPGDDDVLKAFAFGPTYLPGSPTRRELLARYAERTGRDVSNMKFYYAFALFKNAVVAQQIYARYEKGLTKDERFAVFIEGVRMLGAQARRAIESGAGL